MQTRIFIILLVVGLFICGCSADDDSAGDGDSSGSRDDDAADDDAIDDDAADDDAADDDAADDDAIDDDSADDDTTDDDTADDDTSPEPLTIVHEFPPTAAPEQEYEYDFIAEGGVPPYKNWQVIKGELPAGMNLSADTGVLTGTAANEEHLYYFVVQVEDSAVPPQTAQETFGLRVGDPDQPGPLLQKARHYAEIYLARHNMDGLTVTADQPDDPNGDYWFSDLGDATFIHGNTSAGAAFRYAVEPSAETLEYAQLHARGLRMLSDVIGIPGLLGRSYAPKDAAYNPNEFVDLYPDADNWEGVGDYPDYYWKGDVSIDQYSGALVGMSLLYDLVDDESVRGVMRKSITDIADYLWSHDLIVYDPDGLPTEYGDFRGNYLEGFPVSNGLNSAICLAWFKLAYHVSGDAQYQEIYETLAFDRHYIWNLQHFLWVYLGYATKHYNVYMGYENMYTLTRLEDDPELHEIYSDAFAKELWESGPLPGLAWRRGRVEANPTWSPWYLYSTGRRNPEAIWNSIWQMDVFVDAPLRDHYMHNSDNPDIEKNPQRPTDALYPLPANLRVPDMCIWHRSPYTLDGGDDNNRERSGHDYMLPYWMGRYYGYISEEW